MRQRAPQGPRRPRPANVPPGARGLVAHLVHDAGGRGLKFGVVTKPVSWATAPGSMPVAPYRFRVQGGLAWEQLSGGAKARRLRRDEGPAAILLGLSNQYGQLGDASTVSRLTPRAVLSGQSFRQVDAGGLGRVCPGSTDDLAYCWGLNFAGALGNSTKSQRLTLQTPVAGLRRVHHVNAGRYPPTCSLPLAGRTFCWGRNDNGQLGDGTTIERLKPVAVGGTLDMHQVSASLGHTRWAPRRATGPTAGATTASC